MKKFMIGIGCCAMVSMFLMCGCNTTNETNNYYMCERPAAAKFNYKKPYGQERVAKPRIEKVKKQYNPEQAAKRVAKPRVEKFKKPVNNKPMVKEENAIPPRNF